MGFTFKNLQNYASLDRRVYDCHNFEQKVYGSIIRNVWSIFEYSASDSASQRVILVNTAIAFHKRFPDRENQNILTLPGVDERLTEKSLHKDLAEFRVCVIQRHTIAIAGNS